MIDLLSDAWADALVRGEAALPARPELPGFSVRRVVWDSRERNTILGWSDERFEEGRVVHVAQTELGFVDLTLHADPALWRKIDRGDPLTASDWESFEVGDDPPARTPVPSAVGLARRDPVQIVELPVDLDIGLVFDGAPGGSLQVVDAVRDGWLVRRDVVRDATVDLTYRVSAAAFMEYLAGFATLSQVMPYAVYDGPPTGLVTLLGWLQEERFVSSFGFAGASGVRWWLLFSLLSDPRRAAVRRALHEPRSERSREDGSQDAGAPQVGSE